ncbi:hypothetical protein [Natronorubrum sp. FCH18a]|uniref:hypothetical protein n=1 Tax=Natronorubrum sp. FCH18a TaxID=3447018 RepID=UPI003F513E59
MRRTGQRYGTVSRTVFVVAIAAGLLALSGGVGTAAAQSAVVEQETGDAVEESIADVVEEDELNEISEQETTEVEEETVELPDESGVSDEFDVDPVTPVTPETPPMPDLSPAESVDV